MVLIKTLKTRAGLTNAGDKYTNKSGQSLILELKKKKT